MKKKQKLPSPDLNGIPTPIRIYVLWRIYYTVQWPCFRAKILTKLERVDLWLFPPLALLSSYLALHRIFPPHPIMHIALAASAFMSATLTLFILRPPRKYLAHWVH